jgi:hypothetical protein
MCIGPSQSTLPSDPAVILARVINDRLGIEIHPEVLRNFIINEWDNIAAAAHRIHRLSPKRRTGVLRDVIDVMTGKP